MFFCYGTSDLNKRGINRLPKTWRCKHFWHFCKSKTSFTFFFFFPSPFRCWRSVWASACCYHLSSWRSSSAQRQTCSSAQGGNPPPPPTDPHKAISGPPPLQYCFYHFYPNHGQFPLKQRVKVPHSLRSAAESSLLITTLCSWTHSGETWCDDWSGLDGSGLIRVRKHWSGTRGRALSVDRLFLFFICFPFTFSRNVLFIVSWDAH